MQNLWISTDGHLSHYLRRNRSGLILCTGTPLALYFYQENSLRHPLIFTGIYSPSFKSQCSLFDSKILRITSISLASGAIPFDKFLSNGSCRVLLICWGSFQSRIWEGRVGPLAGLRGLSEQIFVVHSNRSPNQLQTPHNLQILLFLVYSVRGSSIFVPNGRVSRHGAIPWVAGQSHCSDRWFVQLFQLSL